jgi:CheY-like chemotaxis protein
MSVKIKLKFDKDAKKASKGPAISTGAKPPPIPSSARQPLIDPDRIADFQKPIGHGRKILVADDNPVVLAAFEMKLKTSGFTVVTTPDAGEVARTAAKNGSELIILDINFPVTAVGSDWNGFSIMQWLRRFDDIARVPVILISGEESSQHREKALAGGAVAFFQKPVSYSELLAKIVEVLGIEETP